MLWWGGGGGGREGGLTIVKLMVSRLNLKLVSGRLIGIPSIYPKYMWMAYITLYMIEKIAFSSQNGVKECLANCDIKYQ